MSLQRADCRWKFSINKLFCLCVCVHCRCECTPGYVGEHCELDYDDCEENKCQNGGQCIDAVNGYTCVCPEGYRWGTLPSRNSHILLLFSWPTWSALAALNQTLTTNKSVQCILILLHYWFWPLIIQTFLTDSNCFCPLTFSKLKCQHLLDHPVWFCVFQKNAFIPITPC